MNKQIKKGKKSKKSNTNSKNIKDINKKRKQNQQTQQKKPQATNNTNQQNQQKKPQTTNNSSQQTQQKKPTQVNQPQKNNIQNNELQKGVSEGLSKIIQEANFKAFNICYYNYEKEEIKIHFKEQEFGAYKNENGKICIKDKLKFLTAIGFRIKEDNENKKICIITDGKSDINLEIVSCDEPSFVGNEVEYLENNIYLDDFWRKTKFDYEKINNKTYRLFNLDDFNHKSLNSKYWSDIKKATAFALRKHLRKTFEMEFLCGLIGNITEEGYFGFFENSNYETNPGAKGDYLIHMDKYHDYRNLASKKYIMDLGVSIFDKLKGNCEYSNLHKFGFGCVQWTAPDRLPELINRYKALNVEKPSFEQCALIETEYIRYELTEHKTLKKIYENWKSITSKQSKTEKVSTAAGVIYDLYEKPATNTRDDRIKRAKEWFNTIEQGNKK